MEFPADLKYTKDHEWIKLDGDTVTVGVTEFAQGELGDVVYVEVETIGETLNKEEVFGTIEAVKTVSDLFMPMNGTVSEVNEELDGAPERVNEDPYGKGWIIRIDLSDEDQTGLISSAEYAELIGV